MQKDSAFFDDLSRLATSATSSFLDVKREMEASMHARVESWLAQMNLVRREEFEVVRELAQKAREENEALSARLAELEARLSGK